MIHYVSSPNSSASDAFFRFSISFRSRSICSSNPLQFFSIAACSRVSDSHLSRASSSALSPVARKNNAGQNMTNPTVMATASPAALLA